MRRGVGMLDFPKPQVTLGIGLGFDLVDLRLHAFHFGSRSPIFVQFESSVLTIRRLARLAALYHEIPISLIGNGL